jgi:hypothetical protein
MENTAELTIGAVALISTIDTCYRGYRSLIASTFESQALANEFGLDLRIEDYRFDLYWQYMGKTDTDIPLLREQAPATQALIADVAKTICDLLTNSNRLAADYGLIILGSGTPSGETTNSNSNVVDVEAIGQAPSRESAILRQLEQLRLWKSQQSTPAAASRSSIFPVVPASIPVSQRVRWAWRDNPRAKKLAGDLKKYNDILWTALSPTHARLLKLAAPSFILPGISDEGTLGILNTELGGNVLNEILVACSRLRRAMIHARNEGDGGPPTAARKVIPTNSIVPTEPLKETPGARTKRTMATLHGIDVIIEFKQISASLEHAEQETLRNRMHQLAILLSEPYHQTLRILPCLGVWCPEPTNDREYGLVFKVPRSFGPAPVKFVTLAALVDVAKQQPPALGDRFKLAQSLSIALMHLHAAGWYHKGIRPENIVFRQLEGSAPDITEPRLLGFDLSRPSAPNTGSLEHRMPPSATTAIDPYMHPERQLQSPPRFHARHDYYALGICLLEIARWRPVAQMKVTESPSDRITTAQWALRVRDRVFQELGGRCGEIYRDVVLACLNGNFSTQPITDPTSGENSDWVLQIAFFNHVVRRLAECRA